MPLKKPVAFIMKVYEKDDQDERVHGFRPSGFRSLDGASASDKGAWCELAEPVMKILEEDEILQDDFERPNQVGRAINRFMYKPVTASEGF